MAADARDTFARLVSVPDAELDLLRCALAVALDDEPDLDLDAAVARFDALGAAGLAGLPPLAPPSARLARLDALLFGELGLDGRGCDFDTPQSSYVHRVLERRTGLPIAMALVWVAVGRRLGLACDGVGFPGHFLAKVQLEHGERVVDPFHQGRVVSETELASRLSAQGAGHIPVDRTLLAAAPTRQVLARLLRNLKVLHLRHGDVPRAFSAVDRLLLVTPDAPDDVRDRGMLCARLGGLGAARRDLTRYLELRPEAPDTTVVQEQLRALDRAARPLLN